MNRAPRSRSFVVPGVILLSLFALGAAACGSSAATPAGEVPAPSPDDEAGASSSGDPSAEGGTSSGNPVAPDGAPIHGPDTVTIVVEPTDKAQALLSAIQAAKKSVHMTMYLLNDKRFINALIAQKAAGLDVKVILNKTFPMNAGTNAAAYSALQAGGVPVVWAATTFTLTHEKSVVIDGQSAWIMTMNLESTSSQNREFLALDVDLADVQEADALFAADFAGTPYVPNGFLLIAPINARDRILQLIQAAKTSIDLEGEELSDYKIVNALAAAQKGGVKVRVVVADNAPSTSQANAIAQLKTASRTARRPTSAPRTSRRAPSSTTASSASSRPTRRRSRSSDRRSPRISRPEPRSDPRLTAPRASPGTSGVSRRRRRPRPTTRAASSTSSRSSTSSPTC
jgi:phosphatidylserine/phosphatidylglycerophosphate/cardiolipin synthase-like enzyme